MLPQKQRKLTSRQPLLSREAVPPLSASSARSEASQYLQKEAEGTCHHHSDHSPLSKPAGATAAEAVDAGAEGPAAGTVVPAGGVEVGTVALDAAPLQPTDPCLLNHRGGEGVTAAMAPGTDQPAPVQSVNGTASTTVHAQVVGPAEVDLAITDGQTSCIWPAAAVPATGPAVVTDQPTFSAGAPTAKAEPESALPQIPRCSVDDQTKTDTEAPEPGTSAVNTTENSTQSDAGPANSTSQTPMANASSAVAVHCCGFENTLDEAAVGEQVEVTGEAKNQPRVSPAKSPSPVLSRRAATPPSQPPSDASASQGNCREWCSGRPGGCF